MSFNTFDTFVYTFVYAFECVDTFDTFVYTFEWIIFVFTFRCTLRRFIHIIWVPYMRLTFYMLHVVDIQIFVIGSVGAHV